MKSTDLSLGVKGFVEIDHLGAKWSRNSVVAQSFLRVYVGAGVKDVSLSVTLAVDPT